jgi:hypothetical protein
MSDIDDRYTAECYTIIGRYDDSGHATVAFIDRTADFTDPHWTALRHTADLTDDAEFEVVAVLKGRVEVLVTQQSLRLYTERLMAEKAEE